MKKRLLLLTTILCLGLTVPVSASENPDVSDPDAAAPSTTVPNPFENMVTTDPLYQAILWAVNQSKLPELSFSDVDETSPYREAILWAMRENITAGYEDYTFRPNNDCTRAQIATFLWRTAGRPAPVSPAENPVSFSDVAPSMNADFYNAILWLASKGVASGETAFDPYGPCTRLTAVEFLWHAAGCPAVKGVSIFTDISENPAINWAVSKGITGGYEDGTFRPDNICTRGQIVTFLHRAETGTFHG